MPARSSAARSGRHHRLHEPLVDGKRLRQPCLLHHRDDDRAGVRFLPSTRMVLKHVESAHVRQHQVEHQRVEVARASFGDRLGPGARDLDHVAPGREDSSSGRLIVRRHPRPAARWGFRRPRRPARLRRGFIDRGRTTVSASCGARGRTAEKTLPLPGTRLDARPRRPGPRRAASRGPAPDRFPGAPSRRSGRVARTPRRASPGLRGAMPIPVSSTASRKRSSPAGSTRTVMRPPSGVNLIAFER